MDISLRVDTPHHRRNNWEDGVLLTGGYRDAGAWINTAWWLSMERLRNSSIPTNKWERLTNISPMFDGGRHNHQMSTAALRWGQIWSDRRKMLLFQSAYHRRLEE